MARIHVGQPLAPGNEIKLPPETAHYINRVLRRGPGDAIRVFNNNDGEFTATIMLLQGTRATVRIKNPIGGRKESPLHTTLVQGLCRSQRMDYCIQKATELGVTRILPMITDRCVVRLDDKRAAKRLDHWEAVATSACEQSGRTALPRIAAPATLADIIKREDVTGRVVFDPDDGLSFTSWPRTMPTLSLFIGPEGGLSKAEIDQLVAADAARWRMGPRILRTETAGVVALTMAQTKWGDLA
ncbi:MAG: 16S rRNA (uracil(1498)-N(3))-methyltransferase [Gammaproteobacteria bacterium]